MDTSSDTYTCPVHLTVHAGAKRETFDRELFDCILNATMQFSYRLYKDIRHGCHCPSNYAVFDALRTEIERSKQTTQVTQ